MIDLDLGRSTYLLNKKLLGIAMTRAGAYDNDVLTMIIEYVNKISNFYDSKFARHKRVSVDAVYKTDWLKERLEEFLVKGDSCTHDIPYRHKHICHFYEGYYDFYNGMHRFGDMKCAIPKKDIIIHFEEVKQNEFHPLHQK